MGLFKLVHDFVHLNSKRFKGSVKESASKMRETRDKLRSCDKVRRLRYSSPSLK